MQKDKGLALKIAAASTAVVLVFLVFFIVFLFSKTSSARSVFAEEPVDKNYHVLVVGQSERADFVNQVFEGVNSQSSRYKAIVELKSPDSLAQDLSLQSLIDYAQYVNADGIIAFVTPQSKSISPVSRIDGTEIPLITIGHYMPDISQVSFIGINYSSLGRKIAMESKSILSTEGTNYIVISSNNSNPNTGNLINSISSFYRNEGITNYELLDKSPAENEERIREIFTGENAARDSIICLTEDDSMMVLQIAGASSIPGRTKILGFGDNETISIYLEKGFLSKLISLDALKIGVRAMTELFEYRNTGYANSYIGAEFRTRASTGGAQK